MENAKLCFVAHTHTVSHKMCIRFLLLRCLFAWNLKCANHAEYCHTFAANLINFFESTSACRNATKTNQKKGKHTKRRISVQVFDGVWVERTNYQLLVDVLKIYSFTEWMRSMTVDSLVHVSVRTPRDSCIETIQTPRASRYRYTVQWKQILHKYTHFETSTASAAVASTTTIVVQVV